MYTLYSAVHFDRGSRVRWLLNELNIPFAEHKLDLKKKEHTTEDYIKINPTAKFPTLTSEKHTIFDSSAILFFLANKHNDHNMIPLNNNIKEYDLFLSWYFYTITTFDSCCYRVFSSSIDSQNAIEKQERDKAIKSLNIELDKISNHMTAKKFMLFDRFTIVDIVVGHLLENFVRTQKVLNNYPILIKYIQNLSILPSAKKSHVFAEDLCV